MDIAPYKKPEYFRNRELSWISFDERVLNEARDKSIPLFERLKFISITSSNLDEFYMVRVASLKDQVHANYTKKDLSGMDAKEQLTEISKRTHELVQLQYNTYNRSAVPSLEHVGLTIISEHEKLEKWEIPTRTENGGSEILPDIAKSVKAKMAEKGIAADDVAGVGIDVPGPVNDKGELSIAVNLNWGYKNIVKELSDELGGMAVKAANDANAAALGEMWAGGGKGSKNLVMVTLGTGVGGGIIVDGKIVAGAHGAGGEVGHACVEPEEEAVCNCGNHGCLEQMTSATGIVRLAKKYLASHDTPSSLRERGESISAKAVFDALKEGDAAAEAIVQEFSEYLGRALAVFACVVDPEVIVVGGGVSKAGQILIDGVAKYYREAAFIACKDTPIVLASLGNDAGIYGAAKMLID